MSRRRGRFVAGLALAVLGACGSRTAADGGESGSTGLATDDTGPELDLPPEAKEDLPPWPEPSCDCEPGATCVITWTDGGCFAGCRELPESCGDAPSCDPACNWDLCEHVRCFGEVEYQDWCAGAGEVTGWACSESMLCSVWLQNCPAGELCRPVGDLIGGSWWKTTACRVPGDPPVPVGGSCVRSGGPFSGADDCERDAICWDVDPNTAQGTCIALCTGVPHDPICPPGTDCVLADAMDAAFCLPPCDPLTDDCAPGYTCTKVGETFACMPRVLLPAGLGQPCAYPNDCAPQLACVDGECVQLCRLDNPTCSPQAPNCTPTPSNMPSVGLCE